MCIRDSHIGLILAQIKGYVAKNNKALTGTEVEKLIREGIVNVTAHDSPVRDAHKESG